METRDETRCCASCRWWYCGEEDDATMCVNGASDDCAEWTAGEHGCGEWEAKA